jgi:hypothetical protein
MSESSKWKQLNKCEKLTTINEEQLIATEDQIGVTKIFQW